MNEWQSAGTWAALRTSSGRWEPLGIPAPTALTDARLQLHHAVQIANSVSISLLPAALDDSHTTLEWLDEARVLATRVIPAPRPFRVAVRPYDFALLVVDGAGHGQNGIPLHGRTIAEAFGWLTAQVRAAGADAARLTMKKHYEIPRHAIADGSNHQGAAQRAHSHSRQQQALSARAHLQQITGKHGEKRAEGNHEQRGDNHHENAAAYFQFPPAELPSFDDALTEAFPGSLAISQRRIVARRAHLHGPDCGQ